MSWKRITRKLAQGMRQMDSKSVFIKIKETTETFLASATLTLEQSLVSMREATKLCLIMLSCFFIFIADQYNKKSAILFISILLISATLSFFLSWHYIFIVPTYFLIFAVVACVYYFDISDYVLKNKYQILSVSLVLFLLSLGVLVVKS